MLRAQSLSPEVEMETRLVSPHHRAGPHREKAISVLTSVDAPCTSLGVFAITRSHTRVGSDLTTAPREYQCERCSALACACKALLARMREAPAPGATTLCGTSCAPCTGWRWKTAPSRDVNSICALISAFSALYLPGKQELEALYCFKVKNGYNKVSSPPETHLGRNFIPCSYLRINFHCFLGVVEQKLLARRGEINVHLEAGVLRDFPAVWTAAKWAVEGFCDGCIEKWALSLFCPDTKVEKKRR